MTIDKVNRKSGILSNRTAYPKWTLIGRCWWQWMPTVQMCRHSFLDFLSHFFEEMSYDVVFIDSAGFVIFRSPHEIISAGGKIDFKTKMSFLYKTETFSHTSIKLLDLRDFVLKYLRKKKPATWTWSCKVCVLVFLCALSGVTCAVLGVAQSHG